MAEARVSGSFSAGAGREDVGLGRGADDDEAAVLCGSVGYLRTASAGGWGISLSRYGKACLLSRYASFTMLHCVI